MQAYIVHVYRAHPENSGSVSGIIEDIDSGQKESFRSFDELQTMLGDSIGKGQLGFQDFTPQDIDTYDKVAVIG